MVSKIIKTKITEMKYLLLSIGVLWLLSSCSTDPYETDKAKVAKAINTTGNTELLRKIKFEKFEPSSALLVDNLKYSLDTMIVSRKFFLLNNAYPILLKFREENLDFSQSVYSNFSNEVKEDKIALNKAQAVLDSAKEGHFYDDLVIDYISEYRYSLDSIYSGDSIAYSYDVIYIIDDAKTTEVFSFYNDKILDGRYTVNDMLITFHEKAIEHYDRENQKEVDEFLSKYSQ